MKKLTRKNLDELAKVMPALNEHVMGTYIGGGNGSQADPFTEQEFDNFLSSGYFPGGYVFFNGDSTGIYIQGGCGTSAVIVSGNSVHESFSFFDAMNHYQNGEGTRVDVQLNSLDLSKVRLSDFVNNRAIVRLSFPALLGGHFSNLNDAMVHGTITLELIPGTNYARVAPNSAFNDEPVGMYDFDMHSWSDSAGRNIATSIGAIVSGTTFTGNLTTPDGFGGFEYVGGTPFPIYYHGSVYIPD